MVAFFAVVTASFFPFFVITFLIVVHELGHFLMAYLFRGEVIKILIYPLGGISKFSLSFNISFVKEFLILIFGPLFQIIAWLFLVSFFPEKEMVISSYHYGILFFNLLPIYPLDGGKLLCLISQKVFHYQKAYYFTFCIGYLLLFLFLFFTFFHFSFNVLFLSVFLLIKLFREYKQVPYFYEKFLLERYLNHYVFKKSKLVLNTNRFYRGYRHLVKVGDNYYLEKEYLEKKYKKC